MAQSNDDNDIKWLYGKLKAKGYNIGSEADFKSSLANGEDRKWYYEKAKGMGLNMGSMADFESMYAPKQAAAPKPQQQKPQAATPQATAPAASQQQKPASAPSAAPAQQKDKPLTPAQRQAMIDQVQQMQQQTQAMIADNNERMKNMKQYGFGLGFGQTKKGGVKYNPRTKKFEQTYITPTGNRYSSKALADAESFRYRKAASEPLGLNMNDQQVNDAQKPASAAVAALWKEAEAKYAADRNKNAEEVYSGNPWLHAGREMHIVDAATNSHKNEVSRLTRFDLQKMMDNAWGRVGKQMTASCYQQLKKQYPTATEQQLQNSASAMARQLSDNAVYKYAVAKNTPKSTLEFFAKTAADMNLLRTISKGLARSQAGTTGDLAAYEQAMGDYGKNHRWAQIGGTVTGMMFDPTTYISGGIGSLGGKMALNVGGRIVAKKTATNVGARLFGNTLAGRVVAGSVGGGLNFGTYEGIKEGENQWLHGGHINPQTGENEGYSAEDILKSTGRGTILGSVTGTISPLLGNVADKWVKATSNTAGKMGIRAGELATSTVAEGTIFSIPEWINGDGDAMDVWTDNMSMMLGFKAQHMVKSAPRVIAGLRPIENPKTMQERNHNRMSFLERLRTQLDASPRDMAFTKEEREELQKYGYGDLAALFTRTPKQQPKAKAKQPTTTDGKVMNFDIPEAEVEDLGKQWLKTHPEFDGYEVMQRLIQDPSVSQSARAKAYYILTGHQLPMGTVTGYTTEKDEHGNIFVKSVTANGEVVTNRRFADEASAKREQDKIMRQAELNSVDVGERYTEAKADNKVWDAAVEAVAPGADPETVKRNYQAAKEGDKDAIANYGQMVDAIDKFMEENRGMADAERPEAIRSAIKEETGVDVDAAIKKEPSKRTEPEQAAVEDYLKRLFPEQNQETEQPMSDDEAGAAAIYDQSRLLWDKVEQGDADAKADVDAIVLRMQEALQECEDAFGTDAEMRMAEMQDNPWSLANDHELTEDQQNAVLYYINAKAAMDGVQDASNDAMENKRREVAANVERHTHKDNGMVQPATMKVDDKPVYIVKGNVAVLPDGTGIDTQNSDQSIVICDAETGEYKFTSPDQIFNLGDAIDPQAELDEAYANIQAEHESVLGGMGNDESVSNSGESVQETPENVQNEGENVQPPMTDEQLQQYAQGAFNEATQGDGGVTLPQEQVEQMQQHNQRMLEQDQQRREEEANRKPTALERVPINEETGEPMFEKADKETALDALNEVTGGNDANTTAIVNAQVEQAQKTLDALKKKQPTKKAPSLKGSPMAMVKAQQEADANYNTAMEQYNAQVAEAEETLGAWSRIYALMNERKRAIREQQEAERRERDARLHDEAVAQVEEQKRIAAQKAAEQAEVGTHAVNPKIKAKWDGAAKVEGNPNALTLADGSTIRGHYVLTEAGAASASHDVNNAFEPTEGFPIDENGESVNDRDYKRDTDAQRIVRDIANSYDSRALQSPVIVSKDGVVLSGNNRTMSGDIAAQQGTDKAYIDHLREFGQMYGFTSEQIDGMKHPRVVFVPDEQLPYDATTFARFNAEQQKKQSKPEHAVKLGKIVPDNVFTSITNDISRFDRLSDYYADDKAVSSAISQLLGAGVINEMQLPEMRTGNSLSAAGKELIENTLIGKVFQTSPDAVRHIISTPTLRQSVIMGLNEIAHNRTLAKSGYDLSQELGAAVDLVARAKSAHPDIFKDGMPVSPFGREQGLFDDEYGDSRVTDGTTLLLADILNSGKPSDLRKVLSAYNAQATAPAGGQLDMFTGDVTSKEEILNTINEHFRNATPREQQALVDAAIAERKRIAETEAGQRGGNKATEQTEDAVQRSAEPQQPAVAETEPAKQEETPQTEEPNTDTIAEEEEEALRNRITETDEEWTEPSANGDIYKLKLLIDGKEVIKVDAPDESKNYPGTYYEVDGKQFGDLQEVVRHLDGAEQPLSAKIKTASADVNTDPTEAQKEAGNYKKGHVQVGTFDITIEQPQGSVRKGTDANGKQWESKMHNTYGYFRGTEGVDGDHIDVFLSNDIDGWNGRKVYVVDQYNPDGTFDEHKVMLGFNDMDEAKSDYLANYEKGWEDGRRIVVSTTNLEDFEKWIDSSHRKTKPFAEYAGVKKETVASSPAKEDTAAPTTENADNAAYTITPTTYTNKKGKTSDVSLLTFDGALTADQERAVSEFAKERLGEGRFSPARGWKDRKSGGWMFRSEEDAKKAADMVGNADAVADAQPLTAQELRDAVEPKKPATRKKTIAKKPANKVEVADVAEQKPTEPTKEEPKQPTKETEKPKYEVSDEEMNGLMNDIRDILGIGADEGDAGLKFRDPDELTAEQRQKLMSVGQRLAMAMVERGNESFGDYASMMVKALGDKVRPWLKAFYGGLEYVPGYDKYALTPYEEVKAFDVENFDKLHKDVLAQADMIVEEGKAQAAADKANNELKAIRNEQRKETDKQTETDTAALAAEAETVASETESLAETSSDEQALNGAAERVDETLDKVNDQLALLGYYEADQVEKDFNEAYGYMRNAEKKAVKDAANLASQLIDDLGLDRYEATHGEADKKGKRKTKPLAVANIAPAGGDVTMHLPLAEGRELYVNIQLEPAFDKGDTDRRGDNLEVTGIMCRVENPNASGNDRYGQNMWFAEDVTYDELLKNVQRATYKYIPERGNVKEGEYKVGDKVQYSPDGNTWHDAVVAQPNELDGIRIDTGQAPVMWVNAHPDQLRHKAQTEPQNEDIFQKAERIAKEAREKKAAKAASEPTTTPASTEQPKPAMKKKASKKKVKPEQQVGNLFAGLFDEPKEENGLQRNDDAVRTETVPTDNRGQQQGLRGGESATRKAAAQESGRPDRGRGGQSTGANRAESAGLHGLTEPKNTRNNHSERGADHAPTSVNGRIEANIKAIELAHELLESGDTATPEQMRVLRQFSGWGGLGAAFSDGGYDWKQRERNKKIRELLGEEAYEQAVMSANSAYYTPAYVVDTLWDIAGQLGFKGGNILEGSAGIGNILGQMPTAVSERSDIHAIEIDGTSGGILSLLYPDAKVDIQGFEQTRIPNGSVDLAITNVPFVTGLRVNDTTGDSDLSKKFHNIHDFCIAKNVRKLREGGLGIFISSNGTLDSSKALRDWVVNEGGSDFIGAFRMNNKTFGGTTVTSDIIVIRKRVNGQKSAQAIDVSNISGERTAEYEEPGARKAKQLSMDYNKYFIEHPDHMAGEMRFAFEEGDKFRPTSKGLYPVSGKDQGKMLADFVKSFTEEERGNAETTENDKPVYVNDASADGKKLGEMYLKDGKLVTAGMGGYYPLEVNDKKIKGHTKQECFNAYAAIKSALADVMKYQTENEGDAGLQPMIDKLNKAYDAFVSTYGHFTKNNQLAWLRNDVDYPNVFSLEVYKEQGDGKGGVVKTYDKADVMKGRVVEKESEPHPENVKDGVVVSMFKNGRIDVPYIAGQLGMSEDVVRHEIIESGLGFEDPATRQMEVSYKYLSGNVREKLKQAEANNENGEYTGNIKALQEVVPMNIPAHLIDFTLGSSWLDPKLYNEYVKDRTDIDVQFTAAGGTWFMKELSYDVSGEKNRAMGVVSEMLKKTVMGHELIEAAIQNKTIVVSRTEKHYDGTTETITDREATSACAAKIDEIRQDFKDWARQKMQSDADLSARMEQEYNDRFNNYVPMSIPDDFVPEYFGGATHKFKMRPHQGKAIVRGTMQPLLLAHEVGTGKTFTLISTAMEMRRLGTAHKPMIVVQNATVGQFAASAKELYPNAKVLVLDDNDRNAEGRKNFYAKIKYNDWDMVIIPQSTLDKIPDSDERQMQFIQDKIDEKMLVLEQMRQADTSGRDPITRRAEKELADLQAEMAALSDDISKKRTANNEKKKAVAKQNAAVKAQEMLDRRTDDVENFDDMGIDALLIDEAHEYKHLGFATAMQRGVKGVDPSYSKKSQGVYLKTQAVLEKNNGRNVIFATGTPISNTAAEIWTFMRYLMPKDTMKEYGIYYFDDFVRNFGNIQQMPEFKTSGRFEEVNRFAGYTNMPELVRIWSSVSDTALTKEQKELVKKIPEMEGGKAQDIYLPQTRALRSVMKYVRDELKRFDEMSGKEKKANSSIPLTMYGIAQRAAVDARLVQVDAEDDPKSKTNEAVRQTLRSLKETDDYKGTVAIFADNYENKRSGFNLYEDIKRKLIEQGVPANEVVVMKAGMKIKQKLDIFDKVNRGEVRVVLGSTATLGTGVNIQERLHTLIHLDAPNRPMDYTQRNGRILRQGNLHKQWGKPVRILRFGVEDSLDVTAYQRLKTKGAIADSVMEGDRLMQDSMNNRVLEEEEDVFGDTVAQLSGSEYALLKNNAEKNVRKYESRRKQWEADQTYIHNAKPKLEGQIKAAEKRAEEANAHLLAVQKAFPDGKFTEITVGKQKFGSVDAMADFIKEHNKKILDAVKAMKEHPSNAAQTNTLTLSLGGYDFVVKTDMSRETQNIGGSLFAEIHRKMTYSCPELGLTDIPVKQSLLRNAVEDITENVITGKDFAERFDIATRMVKHGKSELEQLKQREGKPFEFGKELEEAKRQFEEYSEAMKVEMAEKEKKYAEMDASVEAATGVAVDVEDDTPGGDAKFRSMEMDVTDVADEERDAMTARVNELAERLHTPVRIIRTDEEVAALPSTRQRRMKGSFNPMTGEVTIVVPNNANMADVENTFLHEVVGHDGLRVLFPEEEKLNNALDELYRVSKDGIQDTIDRMARKMYDAEVDRLMRSKRREHEASGGNADAHYFTDLAEAHVEADRKRGKFKRDATEEYGADLAGRIGEKGFEKMSAEELTFWGRLKAVLQNALRKLAEGLGIPGVRKWGDNEWAFVLHEAYKRKRNGGKPSVADAADTVAARESSGFDGELYRVGDVKTFRDGRGIEFRRKPTATFNALLAHLEKEGVKTERHKARTGSEYASFSRYGVMYEVRNADHTKAKSADRRAEESGVEVTDWDGMIRHIDMDLVQARMNAADVYALMDEAERFNSEDEAVRRAATEDGVGSAEFRDAYPTLWRVMGLKSPEEARMEHLRKKYADEYYTARGKELDKLYPFTASNGVTIGRGRKFRVPKSIVYGKGDARRAAEEEFDKAYKKVYDEFIPLDDFVRQREQEGNLEEVNRRFNEQLQLYRNGEMDKNEMLRLGRPQGVMRAFLPNLPIVMRQRILTKGSVRKHNVSVEALANMPTHLAHPIFVFKRSDNALGVLTEMQDRDGKNICVAIELNRQIQNGGEILEVNDIRSVHGRNVSDIVYPIVQNGTLEWADKEKGLAYLSSASRYVQQEIDKQDLDTAAKVVENFENPKVSDEKASDEDLMFRDGDNAEYNKALARDIYERRVSRGLFQTQEALQDSMLGLKEAMDAILKAEGKGRVYIEDVAGFENAYLGENRLSSVNQAECSEFGQRLFKPLLKEAARLAKTAEERAELTDYMMAKHGLERNEVMARRDARKKAREELAKELAKAEKSADKNAVADVKQRMKDRENELYKENRKRDYAGLTALTGMPYVGDAEDEARRMVADYEREHAVKTLWDRVNAVNAATLLKSYESGMISRETYDDIRGMYKNYIPLRGFDEKTAEDAYAYVSSEGRGGFNAPIRTAKGRKSKADDPFANMEAMAESAIMQGNRNVLVKQRFMNFAVNHPSDLVSISDLWLWKNDATGEWQPLNAGGIRGTEAIGEDDTPAEVARKMRDFEAAVEQAAKDDPEHFRRQKENPAVPYRVVESRDLRQHQVIVRRNGRDYVLTINGNPRAAQALNGLTNPDNDISGAIGKIMRFGEKVNRELSAFYTTRNPDFVVSNFLRDMMYANTMVWVKETPNYAVRFHMNVLKLNPAKMKLLLAKFRKGTLNDKDETERMFRQFMMNGGETGYSSVKDIDRRKNDIRRELKKYNGKIPLQGAYTLLGERLDEYNRAVENCARFAAFMTSRQMMRSIDRSVYDAKEISVNFNKKGSGAKFIDAKGQTRLGRIAAGLSGAGRSLYVFFNAAIQGTANYARQFRRHPVKALTGAAVMYLLGTLMAHIGGSGDDDDEKGNSYWDLPEWTRRSNIMFRAGGQWVCIPLPVEYRVFYGMGELAVSAIEGREQLTPGELASAVAAQLSQALPIDLLEGGGGLSNLMPSIVKPGVEAYTNTSWTGLPIYRKNDFNKNDPEWTKAYRNTNKYLVAVAEKLNEATGGDKYTKGAVNINPAQVEYLLNGYFGGVSGTVDKLVKSAETLAGQREYDPRSFLLLNRIVKKGDERTTQRAVNNEYARLEDKFDALGKRLRGYRHDTTYGIFDFAEKANFIYNSPEYMEMMEFNACKKAVDKCRTLIKNSASPEDVKGYEEKINGMKRDIVERLGKTKRPAARAGAYIGAGAFYKAFTEAKMKEAE